MAEPALRAVGPRGRRPDGSGMGYVTCEVIVWFEIAVLVVLVLINGLFSGAEIATVTVRKTRIEQLITEGRRGARAIAELRANPERFLATVQIGITVVGAAAAAYGGDTLAERLTPLLAPLLGEHAHPASFAVVVASISYLSLVLGELVPKSLALRAGEPYALLVARPLLGLAFIARPLVWLLTRSSNGVLKLFGDRTSFTEARVSPDELKAMLEEASELGSLHPRVSEIATRAMELSELRAVDVMVPRRQIVAIADNATVAELRTFVAHTAHSRIPIFAGDIDHVAGYVTVREAFTRSDPHEALSAFVRPIAIMPETMRAVDILHTLQTRGAELALVVDEHGGTSGLLTREDLAEELFGDAMSTAPAGSAAHRFGVRAIETEPDGSALVAGTALVRDVNRALELELPLSDDWTTISGMVVGSLGRIPARGERVSLPHGPILEVMDASPRRVRAVRILRSAGGPAS